MTARALAAAAAVAAAIWASAATLNTVHDIGRAAACGDAGYGIGATDSAAYATIHANSVIDIGPAGGC